MDGGVVTAKHLNNPDGWEGSVPGCCCGVFEGFQDRE